MNYNSKFIVDTKRLRENIDHIFSNISETTRLIPMLKANAYGHGLVEVAQILNDYDKIEFMGVAQVIEALTLKEAGINKRVIIFCGVNEDQIDTIIENRFEPILHNIESVIAFDKKLKENNIKNYPVHLKINTGLNRLGFYGKSDLYTAIEYLMNTDSFEIVSTYSHFINGALENCEHSFKQNEKFLEAIKQLSDQGIDYGFKHICDSGAYEWYKKAHYDAVRIGRALYMDNPNKEESKRFKDVGSWSARIISKRNLSKGETIGYGGSYVCEKDMTLGIINIGYGDGLMLNLPDIKAPLLVNDMQSHFISIAMDQSYIDLSNIDAKIGDTVTLFGFNSNNTYLSSHEISKLMDDEGCTLTTLMSNRVKRKYKQD